MTGGGDDVYWLPIITGILSTIITVGSITWKLSTNMNRIAETARAAAETVAAAARVSLNEHEDKDQERHEDNLKRFEKISVSLARLDENYNGRP